LTQSARLVAIVRTSGLFLSLTEEESTMTATACLALCLTTLVNGSVNTEYYPAYKEARSSGKMLLIDFGTGFDFKTVDAKRLDGFVLCRVPVDYTIPIDGKPTRLIDAPAFDCLQKQAGIVVVDLRDKSHFGETVSVLPQRYSVGGYVDALFDLPVGSLTQRTLTWAFRVHQERPACTAGVADPTLMEHADRQSTVQAQSNSMFHSSSFPGSFEIVAQSWMSTANMADVAIDLVNLWRSSPPHWGAASTAWSRYGVDMQTNGSVWYATGVFQ
jgi:hypothetical protein